MMCQIFLITSHGVYDVADIVARSYARAARQARGVRRQRAIVARSGDDPCAPACLRCAIGADRRTMAQ